MQTHRPSSDSPGLPSYPLRVFSIAAGTRHFVRTLSPRYYGLFTHYVRPAGQGKRGRSVYCEGNDCASAVHKLERTWKGYFAGELYSKEENLWLPVVFEVTECFELDLRHKYRRGQVWDVRRLPEQKNKRQPVEGVLLEELQEQQVPPAFSILECLQHLYHRIELDLNQKNPLPDRVIVQASACNTPPGLKSAPPSGVSTNTLAGPDQAATFKDLYKRWRDNTGVANKEQHPVPSANGNGKH